MLEEFGAKRVIDTPIAELGFTGIGVGAAMNGLRPIVEFMTWNFAILAFDQIVNNAAKTLSQSAGQFKCPIVFRGPSGSAGQLAQQHSQTFESWMANVPGLKVISCIDPADAKGLLKSAIRDENPVCIMEAEILYGHKGIVPEEEYLTPIGVAAVRQEGTDVTLVSFNKMVLTCLEAAQELAKEGISAEVIDLRTIRPIDYQTIINSVKKTNRLVVVDESWPLAGISAEVAYAIQRHAFDYLDAPVVRVNSADTNLPYAPTLVGYASLSYNAQRNKFDFFDKKQSWFPIGVIGATLSIPIFDGLQKHWRIQQSKIDVLKNQYTLQGLELAIEMESITASTTYQNAQSTADTQKKNMELAQRVFDVSEKKYQQGVGSNIEIVNAQTSLKEAQTNYLNALYDMLVSKIDYLKAIGNLVK
jgi:pyruvate dehydrogenase E1 component beta subunit